MARHLKFLFLVFALNNFLIASEDQYGWVQDVVGIDKNVFNYKEGSDLDLELYLKNSFLFKFIFSIIFPLSNKKAIGKTVMKPTANLAALNVNGPMLSIPVS